MALRIRKQLSYWLTATEPELRSILSTLHFQREPTHEEMIKARQLFPRVIDNAQSITIQTIHSYCQMMLNRFPIEAGINPHVGLADDNMVRTLLIEASHLLLSNASFQKNTALSNSISTLAAMLSEQGFEELLNEIIINKTKFSVLFQKNNNIGDIKQKIYKNNEVSPSETEENAIKDACRDELFDFNGLKLSSKALIDGSKTDNERGIHIARWLAASQEERYEQFTQYVEQFITKTGNPRKTLATKQSLSIFEGAGECLTIEQARLVNLSEKLKSIKTANFSYAMLMLAQQLLMHYATLKTSANVIDYDDLIILTQKLLRKEDIAPWILYKLDGGIEHLLVDEAQDTSPAQWDIIESLCQDFLVETLL